MFRHKWIGVAVLAVLAGICIQERLRYQKVRNEHAAIAALYEDYFELKVYLGQFDFYDEIKDLVEEPQVFKDYEERYHPP